MTRYWLRFDDLCPTMDRSRWERAEELLDRFAVTALMAVVPDNQDPTLQIDPPDPDFWDRARAWQERGHVIGLHGYRHLYDSRNVTNLLPFKTVSEFSGHSRDEQSRRIAEGLRLLREQGLDPRVWVAPGHAFDDDTLAVLQDLELRVVSDGFGFRPRQDDAGLLWIPQQTRRPRPFPFGTVTIAFHTNEMSDAQFDELERFLCTHRDGLVRSFDELIDGVGSRNWIDRAWENALLAGFRWKWRNRVPG